MARVQVINEVSEGAAVGEYNLCLQWCRYIYDDPEAEPEHGYRFIWRRPDGSLQAARGQARIPSKARADGLWAKANAAGWDGHVAP